MNYNRLCRLADFKELFKAPEWTLPKGARTLHRKTWECLMAYRTIMDHSAVVDAGMTLHESAEVLGVGAGKEPTIFWLTRHARVFATDLYAFNYWEAAQQMLIDPAAFAPAKPAPNLRNLVVQHMDMTELRYPDESFDAVFSSSSVEHVGGLEDVARAMREIGRVLKPGGVAALSTEFKLDGPDGHGWPGVLVFDEAALYEHVIEPSGLEPVDDLDLDIDGETLATAIELTDYMARVRRGEDAPLPHVVLQHQGYTLTSVHLALRKAE